MGAPLSVHNGWGADTIKSSLSASPVRLCGYPERFDTLGRFHPFRTYAQSYGKTSRLHQSGALLPTCSARTFGRPASIELAGLLRILSDWLPTTAVGELLSTTLLHRISPQDQIGAWVKTFRAIMLDPTASDQGEYEKRKERRGRTAQRVHPGQASAVRFLRSNADEYHCCDETQEKEEAETDERPAKV